MLKPSILVVVLILVPMIASAQQADTTATGATQKTDSTATAATQQTAAVPPPATTDPPQTQESGKNRRMQIGAGAHYMKTIGDAENTEGFNSDALNLLLAGRMDLRLFKLELDSEWALDYGGSSKTLWIPQAFAVVGGLIYGAAGIGSGYVDGDWFDRPVYTLRAGVNLPLGRVAVDVNANYQFMNSKALENLDSNDLDSVTLGATLWF